MAAMLGRCLHDGCETLTIGDVCIAHDRPPERVFLRGRPFGIDGPRPAAGSRVSPAAIVIAARARARKLSAPVPAVRPGERGIPAPRDRRRLETRDEGARERVA